MGNSSLAVMTGCGDAGSALDESYDSFVVTWSSEVKRVLIAAAAMTVAGVYSAQAADLAARPYYAKAAPAMIAAVYDWSGLYIGINGGGGSSHNCWDVLLDTGAYGSEGCHNATGGTIGGQIGYRWQAANWVFGLEGQGNWADFSGSSTSTSVNLGDLAGNFVDHETIRSRINSFGLITGQVGYAFNNVLLYVKGGVAVVDNKFDRFATTSGTLLASSSDTRWGGTVGAGLELGLSPNWSLGVEYNHIFLGNRDVTLAGVTPLLTITDRISQDVDMGLVRLNYKF